MASERRAATPGTRDTAEEPLSPTAIPARQSLPPKSTSVLVILAKFSAFTDGFLSGLVIPLIPTILRDQPEVPREQIQLWTSVLIAAYGVAFVAASPFLPLFWHKRSSIWASLSAALVLAAASFVLLHTAKHTGLASLVVARALQGLSGVLITGASAGLLSVSARLNGEMSPLSWIKTPFIQGAAMAIAPAVSGALYDYLGGLRMVFHFAYAIIAFNGLVALLACKLYGQVKATREEQRRLLRSEEGAQTYGTMASSQEDTGLSPVTEAMPISVNTRSVVALGGCIMAALLFAALQCVLPLEVERVFKWPVSTVGYLFIALFGPVTVISFVTNLVASRAPKSARYLAAIGFLAGVPAFLYLGMLVEHPSGVQKSLFAVLVALSVAIGFCAGPLYGEVTPSVSTQTSMTAKERSSVAVQSATIPNIVTAWGTLIGPLVAGVVRSGWGWETMTTSLAVFSAFSGFVALLFLHGWIGSPQTHSRPGGTSALDEESAHLLSGNGIVHPAAGFHKGGFYERDDSKSLETNEFAKQHRRHFSADNFSISSSVGSHDIAQVRFHASIDMPASETNATDQTSRRSSRGSSVNTERRFLMREAPHAPSTDPLLAAGNRYVIDETRSPPGSANGTKENKRKRHVVVFPEEEVSPELLARRKHHVVTINSLDGSFKVVPNPGVDQVSMQINEEMAPPTTPGAESAEGELRRYVVIILNEGETGLDIIGGESD